ncbi:MAG TPA: hypothetical protein VGO00_09235 [Kofleriaceae bacterium]|jgi:hypothetical protein|nr:hypothetical protein [Kofleriaceae bacterium]
MATDEDAPAKVDPRPSEPPASSPPADERRTRPLSVAPEQKPDKDKDRDDGITETIRQRLEHLVPELVKKTFAAGMGAVFQTEEGIRRIAREVSLPDVAGYIASSADGAKDKVFEVIARETREFLSTLNITDEIAKLLTTLSFEIKTEVRFIPNSDRFVGAEPDVKASVRLKRADTKDKEKDSDDEPERDRSRLRFWRRDDGDGNDTPDK